MRLIDKIAIVVCIIALIEITIAVVTLIVGAIIQTYDQHLTEKRRRNMINRGEKNKR